MSEQILEVFIHIQDFIGMWICYVYHLIKTIKDGEQLFAFLLKDFFRMFLLYRMIHLGFQLRELSFWITAFLEVKIRTIIQCLDNDLFSAPTGKNYERNGIIKSPDLFKEFNPVHPWHLIIRDDCVVLIFL